MLSTPAAARAAATRSLRSAAQYSTSGSQALKSRRKRSSERPTTRNGWPRSASFAANPFPTDPVAPKSPYVIFLICSLLPMFFMEFILLREIPARDYSSRKDSCRLHSNLRLIVRDTACEGQQGKNAKLCLEVPYLRSKENQGDMVFSSR